MIEISFAKKLYDEYWESANKLTKYFQEDGFPFGYMDIHGFLGGYVFDLKDNDSYLDIDFLPADETEARKELLKLILITYISQELNRYKTHGNASILDEDCFYDMKFSLKDNEEIVDIYRIKYNEEKDKIDLIFYDDFVDKELYPIMKEADNHRGSTNPPLRNYQYFDDWEAIIRLSGYYKLKEEERLKDYYSIKKKTPSYLYVTRKANLRDTMINYGCYRDYVVNVCRPHESHDDNYRKILVRKSPYIDVYVELNKFERKPIQEAINNKQKIIYMDDNGGLQDVVQPKQLVKKPKKKTKGQQ